MKMRLSVLGGHFESSENLIKCKVPWDDICCIGNNSGVTLKFKMVSYMELFQVLLHRPGQLLRISPAAHG